MADMNKFNDELLEAGVLLGYDGLYPSSNSLLKKELFTATLYEKTRLNEGRRRRRASARR